MSGSSFLPFGSPSSAPTPTDPMSRMEALANRLERLVWLNVVMALALAVLLGIILFG